MANRYEAGHGHDAGRKNENSQNLHSNNQIVHMFFQLFISTQRSLPSMAITYLRSFKAEVKIFPHIPQTKLILLVIIYIFLSDGRLAFHQRKPFEETFETHSGIPQMQPVWLCIFWGRQFENAFKKTSRWKVKHMQPMLLCILPSKQFDDTCENTKGDEFQTIATNVNLRLLRQAIIFFGAWFPTTFWENTATHLGDKPFWLWLVW